MPEKSHVESKRMVWTAGLICTFLFYFLECSHICFDCIFSRIYKDIILYLKKNMWKANAWFGQLVENAHVYFIF